VAPASAGGARLLHRDADLWCGRQYRGPKYFHYIQADIGEEKENWYTYFDEPDVLLHLAWQGLPNYKNDFHLTKNLPRQIRFLDNLLENGLRSLTITGTCFEYGMKDGELTETMAPAPQNPYGIAKDKLRRHLTRKCRHTNAGLNWVRLFYMYGAGQNERSLFSQLKNALEKVKTLKGLIPICSHCKNIRDDQTNRCYENLMPVLYSHKLF